ncbi:MAG: phosphodiester glycosidase family protein [Deltaproteobacteria bacterium]|jgi:hypothetical protein|nr:phosphodiester glycosidase family protein [Deltaproteobacteria bacterium]
MAKFLKLLFVFYLSAFPFIKKSHALTGSGSVTDPVIVPRIPFAVIGDTTGKTEDIDLYSCNTSLDESGPELVYKFDLSQSGRISAWVTGDNGIVDIDIHLLSSLSLSGSTAQDCLARAHKYIEVDNLSPGTYYIVVDSYNGPAQAGEFELFIDFIQDDTFRDRELYEGILWRQKLYPSLFGYYQTVNILEIDLSNPSVELYPVRGDGCETVDSIGQRVGASAVINAGFYTFDGVCSPVSLVKIDNNILAYNGSPEGTFGLDSNSNPLIDTVGASDTWNQATDAIAGKYILLENGAIAAMDTSSFVTARHPRSAVGIKPNGEVVFLTFDGRTAAGGGVSLPDLAQYMIWLGCDDALNYDGGGSTSMWINSQPFGGIVSYPSDNSTADHYGARAVSTAWAVNSTPKNYSPVILTTPALQATENQLYTYFPDAYDHNPHDILTWSLSNPPANMEITPESGQLSWIPHYTQSGTHLINLAVSDGIETVFQENYIIDVVFIDEDQDEMPDTWEEENNLKPQEDDSLEDADGDGHSNLEEFLQGSDPQDEDDPDPQIINDGGIDSDTDSEDSSTDIDNDSDQDSGNQNTSSENEGCNCRSYSSPTSTFNYFFIILFAGIILIIRKSFNPRSSSKS